ncbi:MAG: hypothetical protein C4575_11525 [Desulforudis sp.]|jgi:hypothetical protein|nr:hypothetical protein [Clostridia bacterium]MDQ7792349.1 hypothetical protein [Clostridia bacterium]RJX18014.1 MAG: hypothetical protein C4575_11525 [Desulforudis sp.]
MEITKWERFWMSFRLYQLWCFLVLNLRILWGVSHSKRPPRFVIEYRVSYLEAGGSYPCTIANADRPPQVGHRVILGGNRFEIIEVSPLRPPRGTFCFLQALCKEAED